ncbi:YphA family membrane protein [Halalkalibacter okhensis]|uniref:Uncharacterized protein n=1 Tax=Halalkalibacter okhensis TaxID=333138 RepID=A0A0B0IK13_9BACI|nr:hypothetical protein [Halalkalibacter okhensis]KHF40354.1 hypothetical protein LQ50_10185 [Halalkalibacter okhensis]
MEGVFIYWFGWLLWVVITFFWSKSKARFWSAFSLLLFFILLPKTFVFANTTVYLVYVLFSVYLFWQLNKAKKCNLIHSYVASITIAAAYAGFQMMMIFDPIVVYIDSRWMIGIMTAIISFFLAATFMHRLLFAFSGLIQGELLTGLVTQHHLYMDYSIGSLYFFDIVAVVGSLYSVVWGLKQVSAYLGKVVIREPKSGMLKQSS